MPPVVAVENVSKTFDRVQWVLRDVSLAVEPGEAVVVMGRSGSGKSTLLNLIAGLETPTKGRVVVDGRDLASLDESDRAEVRRTKVGVVFQRFHLVPELTVLENVVMPMRFAKRRHPEDRATELLGFLGLERKTDAFPATLSGGEVQRAAIARALANEPAVLLADEPTANLDEENAKQALRALERVSEALRTAVVIASHDPIVEAFGDRVERIVEGRFVGADGIAEPASERVVRGRPVGRSGPSA